MSLVADVAITLDCGTTPIPFAVVHVVSASLQ